MHPVPRPDQVRVVIGDVHAAPGGLEALLRHIGAIDDDGNHLGTHFVAQLGDLLHLGHTTAEADRRTLELGSRWIDLQLLGNHEGFYAYGLDSCWWQGMASPDQVHPDVLSALRRQANDGRWQIAATMDGWLLTHAGLHPVFQPEVGTTASIAAAAITQAFAERLASGERIPVIDRSGPVRGYDPNPGGVLWCDLSEIEPVVAENEIRQIVGHTPQEEPRMVGGRIWAIDGGGGRSGRVSAVLKQPGDDRWTPLTVEAPDPLIT